jgi:hypothetical protein
MKIMLEITVVSLALAVVACKPHDPMLPMDDSIGVAAPVQGSVPFDVRLAKGRAQAPDLSQLEVKIEEPDDPVLAVKAVPARLLTSIREERWADVTKAFVPDQKRQMDKFAPLAVPLIDKGLKLARVGFEKLGAPPGVPPMPDGGSDPLAMLGMAQGMLMMASVTIENDDSATWALAMPFPGLPPEGIGIPFRKNDGRWRIEIPGFPPAQMLDQIRSTIEGHVPAVLDALDTLTAQIEDGTITSWDELEAPLETAVTPALEALGLKQESMPAGNTAQPDQPSGI